MTSQKADKYFATRKRSKARVYITGGAGRVRINSVPVEMIGEVSARETVLAPLEIAGESRDKVDVSVRVSGGGYMGQAGAAATGISRALVGKTKSGKEPRAHPLPKEERDELRAKIDAFDRHLISGDARRREPKKFGGPGARRRKQKSYR